MLQDDENPYFPGDDDPTRNAALMVAIGRLVVRSAELEEMISLIITRLCDRKTKEQLPRLMLGRKLEILLSLANQIKGQFPVGEALSRYCSHCLCQLKTRNSPVHSTYIIDDDGIVKWDSRQGPEVIQVDAIEKSAKALYGLKRKALEYSMELMDLRRIGQLLGGFVPPKSPNKRGR